MPGPLRQELALKQTQTLNITQEMRLRIELLQKNMLDLREMLMQETEENPFLEIEDWGDDADGADEVRTPSEVASDQGAAEGGTVEPERQAPLEGEDRSSTMSDILAEFDWRTYQEHSGNNFGDTRVRRRNDESEDFSFEDTLSEEEPITRRLDMQIAAAEYPEHIKEIMTYIVYNLDGRGFLRESDEEVAQDLGAVVDDVRYARRELRMVEPEGTASCDLAQYLRFMFTESSVALTDPEQYGIIGRIVESADLMDSLMKKDFDRLCRELTIGKQELGAVLAVMKKIAPYPFFGYEQFRPEHVIPDIHVYLVGGEVIIEIEKKFIPSIRLNRELYEQEIKGIKDKKKKEFMKERFRAAEWLVKSLSERNKTLYEVAASLFNFQKAFLENGEEFLKPLTLKDISEDIGRHQSTVSRLTSGKYAVTPHGIFELKAFFVKKVNDESVATTNRHLEARIKELVEVEEKDNPLSDEDITRLLSREGIEVARRTIAKYRAKLRIPSARERRRDFEFSAGG